MKKKILLISTILILSMTIIGVIFFKLHPNNSPNNLLNAENIVDTENTSTFQNEEDVIATDLSVGNGVLVVTVIDNYNIRKKDVEFELINDDNKLLLTFTTNENGKAKIQNIPDGKYYFLCTPPDGFTVENSLYTFTVNSENKTFYKTLTIKQEKLSTLIVNLIDNDQNPLSGGVFEIWAKKENSEDIYVNTIETHTKGLAGLTNLPIGEYHIKQITAPEGYEINSKIHDFTATANGNEKTFIIVNEKK